MIRNHISRKQLTKKFFDNYLRHFLTSSTYAVNTQDTILCSGKINIPFNRCLSRTDTRGKGMIWGKILSFLKIKNPRAICKFKNSENGQCQCSEKQKLCPGQRVSPRRQERAIEHHKYFDNIWKGLSSTPTFLLYYDFSRMLLEWWTMYQNDGQGRKVSINFLHCRIEQGFSEINSNTIPPVKLGVYEFLNPTTLF